MPRKFSITLKMKKSVIITGGTTGIGKATAVAFAEKGYNVVVTSRNPQKETEILAYIKEQTGAEACFFTLNVDDEQAVKSVIEKVVEKFGKLDVMVNNAAQYNSPVPLAEVETSEFKKMIDTNILGLFYGMKYAIASMLKTGGGSVVNLASIAGANGFERAAAYSSTKHAVVGLTKSAALDYATQGIRINAIAPGVVRTDILNAAIESGMATDESFGEVLPIKRTVLPEEIAGGIVFLASDDCKGMTGNILFVDGGYNAK